MLLVRDRFGIKPLYVAEDGARLVFGSELTTVLAAGGIDRRPDLTALADFLRYQYVPAPRTAYLGVRALSPGSMLVAEDGRTTERRWWDLPLDASSSASATEVTAMIRERLTDAVDAHRLADVPLGVFLSGGVDSSAVAALLRQATDDPLRAFTIGFDVRAHSEVRFASEVADHLGLEHHVRDVAVGDVVSALDSVLTMYGQPFADGSAPPTRAARSLPPAMSRSRSRVTVATRSSPAIRGTRDGCAPSRSIERPVRPIRGVGSASDAAPHAAGRMARRPRSGRLRADARMVTLFHPEEVDAVAGPALRGRSSATPTRAFAGTGGMTSIRSTSLQVLDLQTYLPDDILTKVDRASMAVGLEVRPPLLDHELVEAVMALPPSQRVPEGEPKALLKAAVRDLVPADTFDRPKHGFSAPWNAWMQELGTWADEQVRDGAAVASGIVDPDALSVADADPARRGPKLWSLLVLERWCRANL